MEIWKEVKGYEGLYQVSDLGNVKTIKTGRILKPYLQPDKHYLTVKFNKDKKGRTVRIHKLVAVAFHNHIPCGMKEIVDHINGDKQDNRAVNLQLLTQRENIVKARSSEYDEETYFSNSKQVWVATANICGKYVHLGNFDTQVKAKEEHDSYIAQIRETYSLLQSRSPLSISS